MAIGVSINATEGETRENTWLGVSTGGGVGVGITVGVGVGAGVGVGMGVGVAVGARVFVGGTRAAVAVGKLSPPPHAEINNADRPIRGQTKGMPFCDIV